MEDRDYAREYGVRCRQIRQIKKMSQQELADKMNVTNAAVSKWESNGITDVNTIRKLSDVLGQDIMSDQIDQEGAVGEIGKEILDILVTNNGHVDYDVITSSLYGMKEDRISNELFKLERIGAVIREQYKDFLDKERDVVFVTAKGVVVFKNNKMFVTREMLNDVTTYDQLIFGDNMTYQDVVNNDHVTKSLLKLDGSGYSYRCDYIKYLLDNYFCPGETGNKFDIDLYMCPETADDYLLGDSCYKDILHRMAQSTNRKEIDTALRCGLDYWTSGNEYVSLLEKATGMDEREIEAAEMFSNYYDYRGEELKFKEHDIVSDYMQESGIAEKDKTRREVECPYLEDRVEAFLRDKEPDKRFLCSEWFTEADIRKFVEENFLEAQNESERKIDEILKEIWEADKTTLKYYYSFPKSWEENGLAQLVRDKVGVPAK